ncbi:MAG: hypothetical protein CMP10_04370 [Zetaproteobacteria bacterium]|nr:hypothetical protein [Pseudobdellovibrionaceae bacterium]
MSESGLIKGVTKVRLVRKGLPKKIQVNGHEFFQGPNLNAVIMPYTELEIDRSYLLLTKGVYQ